MTGQELSVGGNDGMLSYLSFPQFVSGFVQTKANSWHLITSDKFVLDLVTHGFTVPFSLQGPPGMDVSPSIPLCLMLQGLFYLLRLMICCVQPSSAWYVCVTCLYD